MYITGSKEYNTPEKPICAPIFKRNFLYIQDKNNGAVKLKIYATGFYRLFVNDRELTKGYFAPYIANPDDYAYYDEYVLDDVLKAEGNNVLYVLLGNGFGNSIDGGVWNFEKADYRAAPKFYLEIVQNGTELLRSDEFFEVCDSPIVFDDYRCGEWYDARKERNECNGLFTGEKLRKAISVPPPKGEEKLCKAQPIKAFEMIFPVRINRVNGGYIYDFGVNFAGIAELNIDGENGEEIDLTFGEVLQNGELDLGNISFGERSRKGFIQHDKYICKACKQTWKPCFSYHGCSMPQR